MARSKRFTHAAVALIGALFAALAGVAWFAPSPASAVVEVDITRGQIRPIPIAIAPFLGSDGPSNQLAANITGIVTADLERSGLFKPIARAAFIERIFNIDEPPRFNDWRAIKAEALGVGHIANTGDGRIKAQYRLWDVFSARELKGEQFYVAAKDWRRIGDLIADAIYKRLTGEKGYFDSR
ncbi:MAG: Tol-Pal system protein TolB, partial [Alphaproteobacteria bacterium]